MDEVSELNLLLAGGWKGLGNGPRAQGRGRINVAVQWRGAAVMRLSLLFARSREDKDRRDLA
jgi:hypothetical protein